MIKFRCDRMDTRTRTPILRDVEVEAWAERVLLDYKPDHLKEPGKLNALFFVENYLEATIEYQDIYYPAGNPPIIGATAFNDETLRVFDKENMRTKMISVKPRTVILDNSIMADRKKGLCAFTVLHEGGHLFFHEDVYTRPGSRQLSLLGADDNEDGNVVCCHRENIEGIVRKNRIWTERDYREHHANVFSAATAMPRRTFIPYAQEIMRKYGERKGYMLMGNPDVDECVAPLVADVLSYEYGVSRKAAMVNLKKRGLYVEHEQLAICR